MNRREALIHLAAGGKVRSSLMKDDKSFLKMNDLGQVLLVDPLHGAKAEILPDVEYEAFTETEEVGIVAYVAPSVIAKFCEDVFGGAIQVQSQPNNRSYVPVRITWDQEIGIDDGQEVPGQQLEH